jgi:Putative prokaryotic signal transducing protein
MNEDFVTVLRTYNLGSLAIAKSLLNDADIDYAVQNENFGSIYNGFYSVSGFIEIQVRKPEAEIALELLADLQEDYDESEKDS